MTDLVSGIDLVPALLDALGGPIPADGRQPGARHGVVGGPTWPGDLRPAHLPRLLRSAPLCATGSRKLIVNFSSAPSIMDASQSWHRRCTPRVGPSGPAASLPVAELYDLDADPTEMSNLIDDPRYADDRAALLSRLRQWLIEVDDPLLAGAVRSPSHDEALSGLGIGTERP